MKAVGWRLLVRQLSAKPKTAGGIFIPKTSQDAQEALMNKGIVVDIGPLAYTGERFCKINEKGEMVPGEPWCKVGDAIAYDKHAGKQLKILEDGNEVTYRFVNDTDVLTVLEKDELYKVKTYVYSDEAEF